MSDEKRTIYVVTSGCYSDYNIDAVFDDKELAELYIKQFGGICDDTDEYGSGPRIEEYEVNASAWLVREGYYSWTVRMREDGSTVAVEKHTDTKPDESVWFFRRYFVQPKGKRGYFEEYGSPVMLTDVLAKDEQHAVKIANERRVRAIAENRWGKA